MLKYDTIVLGAGTMGMPTAVNLARAGQKVLLLDKFDVPHAYGSHHGETRMLRVAYTEGAAYVPLVTRARELWLELEDACGRQAGSFFASVGALNVMPPSSPSRDEIDACVQTYALPYERFTAQEARKRWPGLAVPDGYIVHFDPQGGVIFSEASLKAWKSLAVDTGIDFEIGSVQHIDVQPSHVTVRFEGADMTADNLVLTTGAATQQILAHWFPEWSIPLQPTRKVIAWYEVDRGVLNPYQAPTLPAYSIETERGWFYGFPDFGNGLKVGRHDGGTLCDPSTLNRAIDIGSDEESELRWLVENYFPNARVPAQEAKVCMYNMTPDEHFVIDTHPEHQHVVIATGFSGHGFKFAPAIAEVLCQLVTEGSTKTDLSLFRVSRFAHHH